MIHHEREDGLVVKAQLLIFLVAFISPIIASALLSKELGDMVFKMVDMLFICGTILLAIKLAREGWDMAAAGFTILGIGWGVLFASLDFQQLKIDGEVRTSAAYFFIPCMILIAYYRPFPWWIKGLTLWCFIPFSVALLLQKTGLHNEERVSTWLLVGFSSFHTASILWAIFFYRQWRKQKKDSHPK